MVKKKKEENQDHHDCGKKYFYLFSSFMVIILVIMVALFLEVRKSNFSATGQAGSLPSITPDTDFAQFKQCLCGAAKTETAPMSAIVVPPVLILPKAEICNNQKDDNDDKLVDCADVSCDGKDCGSTAAVSGVCTQKLCVKKELACHDGIDNDGDGKKDCDDVDCWEIDMVVGSKDYGKNKCWQLPDNGAKKVGSSYLGLSGHFCQENKDCADGWCIDKHYNLPSLGGYCAPLCTGEKSCQDVYSGLSTICKQITNTCPDCISICTSPYGVK